MPSCSELCPRLAAVARGIPARARVADLGTDHALLPLWLARSRRASWILATERTASRLRAAREALRAAGIAPERVSLRAGDGLAPLSARDALQVVSISGLGGGSIVRILERDRLASLGVRRLVLQPQGREASVRSHLDEIGWGLVEETLVEDGGHVYTVLAAEPGDAPSLWSHSELDREDLLAAGPLLLRSKDPAVLAFWERRFARLLAMEAALRRRGRGQAELGRAQRILAVLLSERDGRTPGTRDRRGSIPPPPRTTGHESSRRSSGWPP